MSDPCKLPNSSFKESCNFSITTGHTHLRLWQLRQHEGWLLCLSFHYASCSMLNVYHPLLHLRVLLLLWEELRKCKCVMFQGLLATTCYSCAVKWVSCRRLPRSKAQKLWGCCERRRGAAHTWLTFKECVTRLHSSSVVLTGASPHYAELHFNDASLTYLENPC